MELRTANTLTALVAAPDLSSQARCRFGRANPLLIIGWASVAAAAPTAQKMGAQHWCARRREY